MYQLAQIYDKNAEVRDGDPAGEGGWKKELTAYSRGQRKESKMDVSGKEGSEEDG
jgi:hypothetical protein